MNPLRLRLEWLLLLMLALAAAVAGHLAQATYRLDNRLLDFATSLARSQPDPDIFVVEIDDRALAEIGAWPWPRSVHADLVERLDAAGARLVVLDVLFVEPTAPSQDAALAQAMAASGKVLLPFGFAPVPDTLDSLAPVTPLAPLASAARATGHVAAMPDDDGVLRRFALYETVGGERVPHLAVSTLRALGERLPQAPPRLGDDADRPLIAFQPTGSYPALSAADVLRERLPKGLLRGKTVLVGATAAGLGDRYAVASGSVALMPGVETQANLLDALRSGSVIFPYPDAVHIALAVVALSALFLVFWFLPPRYGLLAAAMLVIAAVGLSILLVVLAGRWLPVGSLALVILLAYPLWSWRRLSAVSAYLDREAVRLGGETRTADEEGVDFIARQVSRMRRLVTSVEDSLAFLRQVIEAAPDAILVLGRGGATQMMNARASGIFPEWRADDQPDLRELLAGIRATLDLERGEMTTEDGRTYLVARAPLGRDPSAAGEILALREVTDMRRREEERRQMLEFLSHDMRTPQAAIIGLTRPEAVSEDISDTMRRIRAQAKRTLKLADDFVQLARLEEASLDLAESEMGALVEEAADRFFAAARSRRIVLARHLPEDPLFALVDASTIARLLDNLVGNAIKYAPEGSTVELALAAGDAGWLRLSVADQGPGLPPERARDIFARFGSRERGHGPSAGLGLAFVKRAVEAHGGRIEVDTGRGCGTCFLVSLPLEGPGS